MSEEKAEINNLNFKVDISIHKEDIAKHVEEKWKKLREQEKKKRQPVAPYLFHPSRKEYESSHYGIAEYNFMPLYPFTVLIDVVDQKDNYEPAPAWDNVHIAGKDRCTVVVHPNVPMQVFHEKFKDFCREVLGIEFRDLELEGFEKEYLEKVEKGVNLLKELT